MTSFFSKQKIVPMILVLLGIFALQRFLGSWVPSFNWGTIVVGALFLAFFLAWGSESASNWMKGWGGGLVVIILGTVLGVLMGIPQLNQKDIAAPLITTYPFQEIDGELILNKGADGSLQLTGYYPVEFGTDVRIAVQGKSLGNATLHAVPETEMVAYNAAVATVTAGGTDPLGSLSTEKFLSTFGSQCGRHSALKWGDIDFGAVAQFLPDTNEDDAVRWYRWACSGSQRIGRYMLLLQLPTGANYLYSPNQEMIVSLGTMVINPSPALLLTGSGPVTTTITLPTIDPNVPAAGTFR